MSTRRAVFAGLLAALVLLPLAERALAATVGQKLPQVTIRDANNNPATIPDLGRKVLAIFYSDPDVADMNDPFADRLKQANLDLTVYRGLGIANLKDTWLPDEMIRAMVRKKIEKYNATILTDPDHLLSQAWSLGDCNGSSVVLIVDKTGTLRYLKKGAMSTAEIEAGHKLVLELMAQ